MPDFLVEFDEFESLAISILREGQNLRFRARGASMHPFIQDGDLVEVQPVEANSVRRGDVVFCRLPDDRLVVHRVIRAGQGYFLTQGDALPHPDGRVPAENVLGRVDFVLRRGKLVCLNSTGMTLLARGWRWLTILRQVPARLSRRMRNAFFSQKQTSR